MKRIALVVLGLVLVTAMACAEEVCGDKAAAAPAAAAGTTASQTAAPAAPEAAIPMAAAEGVTLNGVVIDNMCAGAHTADLAEFVKAHTKQCTLVPACVASGYSLYREGTLTKFDQASNAKIEEFLKKDDSTLAVSVVATQNGDELTLVSIANQM